MDLSTSTFLFLLNFLSTVASNVTKARLAASAQVCVTAEWARRWVLSVLKSVMTSCLLVIIIIIFSLWAVQGRAALKLQVEETREIIYCENIWSETLLPDFLVNSKLFKNHILDQSKGCEDRPWCSVWTTRRNEANSRVCSRDGRSRALQCELSDNLIQLPCL